MGELARKALQSIRQEGGTTIEHTLIERTLREIDEAWQRGILEWMRRTRPTEFEKLVALEGEINRVALERNVRGLEVALRSYKEMMTGVAEAFRAPKGETGDLFRRDSEGR